VNVRRPALSLVPFLALVLTGCGGGSGVRAHAAPVTATGPAQAQVAEVKGDTSLVFVPSVVNAKVGTLTLTLGNIGGTPHNLTFDDRTLPAIGLVSGTPKSTTLVFGKPGEYRFVCTIHAGMAGKVVVTG
jgi:plastocyanin